MTYSELHRTVRQFPNDFILFEAREGKTLSAAVIIIRINSDILYTFYYGHNHVYDKISPMVFLIGYIYGFARKNSYQFIDLGTSMSGLKINQSLLQFKKNMGGKTSIRCRFEKMMV